MVLLESPHAATPAVSVIVPVYNGGEGFIACLEALRSSAGIASESWEIIVVDDGSTDGSAEWARAGGIQVVPTPRERSGPAAARNVGAGVARGDVLFFVDADVLVTPDTLARVVAAFRSSPAIAALFGSYDTKPAAPNPLSQYKNLFHHYVHQTSSAEATTFWAGCGAVRTSVFHELGGFDERYQRPCIEDIEFGYRLTRAGYKVRLCHELQVTHLKRWTATKLLRSDIFDRGIPWAKLLVGERAFAADLNLQASNRISVVCIYLLGAVMGAALLQPRVAVAAVPLVLALFAFNAPLYRFFRRQRGAHFLLVVVPWHWLYYGYSGLCFIIGTLAHFRSVRESPTPVREGQVTTSSTGVIPPAWRGEHELQAGAWVAPLHGD